MVAGIRLGASVDVDSGLLQNPAALADDTSAALPDDEDGVVHPASDLILTIGAAPTVSLRATNLTGASATLYGWIDYNRDGVFDNTTERALTTVASGTASGVFTLTFPAVPEATSAGATYARFRFSTDVAAASSTGAAADGEVEDYRVTINRRAGSTINPTNTKLIAHNLNGGPALLDSDQFGDSVAKLGDLDGDGVNDLAVGAISTGSGTGVGAVHILYLNSDGSVKSRQKISSGQNGAPAIPNGSYFGRSIANLGDIDGDGVIDLAVAADRDSTLGNLRGAVYVLLMNSNGTVKASQKIAHGLGGGPLLADIDRFGGALAPLGGLDGDGITDLAVGASNDDTGGLERGAVHILLLNSNGTAKSTFKLASGSHPGLTLANNDYFGGSVSSLGDLDGDGVTELAVGAWGDDSGGAGNGAVYVLFLNSNGSIKNLQKISDGTGGGPILAANDFFGNSLESVGDLDGDGVTDLAAGARYDDTGGPNRGAVYMLLLNANGTVKKADKIGSNVGGGPALNDGDIFGRSMAVLGDLNGDGVVEMAFSAERGDIGGPNRGGVYVASLKSFNNNPVITSPATANVAENTTSVLTVTASDPDVPVQLLTFSIFGGADQAKFAITSGGVLTFLTPPNFEAPTDGNGDNQYEVVVQVSDSEGGATTQSLLVSVTPTNDNLPVFTSANVASVAENTTAVLTVTATDADLPGQSLAFSLVGGADQAKFSITSGGVLSFVTGPDFEAPTDANSDNIYQVVVAANDGLGGSSTQSIQVTVTSVNDNVPVFTSTNAATVAENTTAVLTVTATDADLPAQSLSYLIFGGADQAKFAITSGGVLTFVTPPDFEVPTDANGNNQYEVVVQVSDSEGGATTQSLLVTVTPVNDNNPVFTSLDTASVAENTTAVLTVTATDADLPGQALTYSLVGGADQAKFSITSGGVLSFVTGPDFEAPTDANSDNIYQVIVAANDGFGGSSTQTIQVTVTSVNDNGPEFTSPDVVSVPENATSVIQLVASDADLPAQTVSFSIVGGADRTRFSLTPGGALSFVTPPNFEAPTDANLDNSYVVIVQASDGAFSDLQALIVNVSPVNEFAPVITSAAAVNVAENTTAVLTVTATDADLPGQALTYSLVGGVDQAKFTISPSGQLAFLGAPDFEIPTDADTNNTYLVTVRVSDGSLSSTQDVTVTVTDVFDPLLGDYNSDNTVDSADYTVWRDTLGQSVPALTGADGSGNGLIDPADYAVWVANFGQSRSFAASAVSVSVGELAESEIAASVELSNPKDDLFRALSGAAEITTALPRHAEGIRLTPGRSRSDLLLQALDCEAHTWPQSRDRVLDEVFAEMGADRRNSTRTVTELRTWRGLQRATLKFPPHRH